MKEEELDNLEREFAETKDLEKCIKIYKQIREIEKELYPENENAEYLIKTDKAIDEYLEGLEQ